MAGRSNAWEMHEKILNSALIVFSEKGYSAATIKDISYHAGCNTVTIFRHFEDKLGLFLQVVERFHEFKFDAEELNTRLGYMNLHNDFRIMADYFFDSAYQHIHIMRIFINDGHNFEPISKYLWFIPDQMKEFVINYIHSMYLDRISVQDASMLTEMFLCYIIRTCLRLNVHDGVEENSRKIAKEAKAVLMPGVDMIVNMILLHLKKQNE